MKLIPKDALVVEIEKRIKETESMQPKFDQFWAGQISAFKGILKILDTLEAKEVEEESVSEDLDNFATKYAQDKPYPVTVCQAVKVGANWQKAQMMKDAISGEVTEIYYPTDSRLEIEATLPEGRFEDGDKVLIIKED